MHGRHLLVSLLALSGGITLGCSGLGGSTDAPETKSEGPKLKVGSSSLKKGDVGGKAPGAKHKGREAVKHEYVVKLRPGVEKLELSGKGVAVADKSLTSVFGSLDLETSDKVYSKAKNQSLAEYLGLGRTIRIKTKMPEEKVRAKLESHKDVEMVEPVIRMRSMGEPNDEAYSYQWHMKMLQVTKAWETTMGEGVVVAVIDTGVSEGDDGFYKLLPGYDFVEDDSSPDDGNGHGTHVAGTIAQEANNRKGVVGVAPKASILPVRVLGADGGGSNTWVANGIVWAVDHGANIINMSLGSHSESEVVADACTYAYEQGVTVFAATGNDGFTDHISYPAALPTTIAVGSVEAGKKVSFYSNQGNEIDIVAPGGDTSADLTGDGFGDGVLQQTIQGGVWDYQFFQGTSMATPHAAGVAALVYARGVTDPDAIRELLTSTADDLGPSGFDTTYGHGLVNPVAALAKADNRNSGTSGDVTITRKKVKKLSDNRAMIAWITNKPATTLVKGKNGFQSIDKTPVKIHRVTVEGTAGKTLEFQIQSGDGSSKDGAKVDVTF